jgi:2',3'-cyclic-nucleotide 2'-phosphodiesterase (5'-nucleotidase family)
MPLTYPLSRRRLLKYTAAGTIGGSTVAACADDSSEFVDAAETPGSGEPPVFPHDQAGHDHADGTHAHGNPGENPYTMCPTTLTISMVHVNDLHAGYQLDSSGISPVARLVGYYRQVQRENSSIVFTNAGDDFEKGSVAEVLSEGRATLEIAKALPFDIRCIGNHDFAWSEDLLLEYSDNPSGTTLCSNVEFAGPDPERWKAVEFVKRTVGCVRIGYFGMVGKPWNEFNEQVDGSFYPNFPMRHDYVERARELVATYRESVDVMVMLSHLGLGQDREIAREVDGIDIILGGHSHSIVVPEEIVNNTIIVQAGASAQWIAHLDLEMDGVTREILGYTYQLLLNAPSELPVDDDTQAMIEEVLSRLAPEATEVVGICSSTVRPERLAQMMARAASEVLPADAALIDRGTAWTSVPRGEVTRQDFINAFTVERQPAGTPGYNSLGRVSLSGASLMLIRDAVPADWGSVFPDTIEPEQAYTFATQRHIAGRLTERFGIDERPALEPAGECFAVLADWATRRMAEGVPLDD